MDAVTNLAAHVLAAGQAAPDRIALAILGAARAERWSYARLIAAVLGTAAGLRARGVMPGDRILLRLGNTADFPLAFLGAIAAGAVPVPTAAGLTAPEVARIAAQVGPRLAIEAPGIAPAPAECARLDLEALRGFRGLAPLDPQEGDPERPAYIVFTSGTEGVPRGVVHAHRAILGRGPMGPGWHGIGPGDRVLHAGALNWTYTLGAGLLDPWRMAATALIPEDGTGTAALALLARRHDATILAAVPGVFRQMLRDPLPAMPKLRHALSAGEKLPETLRSGWRAATGIEIHEAYGLSECSTFLSGSPDRPAPPGTLGFPQPGRRVALIEGGREGEAGIIAVHRSDPGLMLGYLDAPEAMAARIAGDWFLTGDRGRRGPDGAILWEGRGDDMLNAGGFRVSPVEIEEALCALPEVTEAAAVDLRLGPETVVIGAFWSGPREIEPERLAEHLAGRLAHFKHPRVLERVEALPRGANGKLLRRRLREEWERTHGQA